VSNGVEIAGLADPDDESVLTFRPGQPPRVRRGADRLDLGDVVPGFELGIDELFQSLRRP
jgi:Uma2 family endonuclease